MCVLFFAYTFFMHYSGDVPEKRETGQKPEISSVKEAEKPVKIPKNGILALMGKTSENILKSVGKPSRKEPSRFDYEWWIYNQDPDHYFQVGILNGKAVTVYGLGKSLNIQPFKIGEDAGGVFKKSQILSSLPIEYKGNTYKFELSEEDMNTRPAIRADGNILQLYIDKFDGKLSSVRAVDPETFIKQRPYELIYRGNLVSAKKLKEDQLLKVEKAEENQVFDLTNVIRSRHHLPSLKNDSEVAGIAYLHSKDMADSRYFAHESPTEGDLSDRLKKGKVAYSLAGENIAAHYIDGIASVEGWMNSKGHREAMLNSEFTHLGVGVYRDYYTQDYVKYWN